MPFVDRADAGRRLADRLRPLRSERPVVVGLPRGGVPVALEVARALDAPLDVLVVRKLGYPAQPELGMGAIGEGGVRVLHRELIERLDVPDDVLASVTAREQDELARRVRTYRGDRAQTPVAGRLVVVVDDGLATGFTARAAIEVLRQLGAARVVLAVPVAARESAGELRAVADDVVVVETPERFFAIGQWYDDFAQLTDADVARLLAEAAAPHGGAEGGDEAAAAAEGGAGAGGAGEPGPGGVQDVAVPMEGGHLPGVLTVPAGPGGIVVFAHGSGSSRHSPRNRAVAETLQRSGLGTLLFDLLTPAEADDRRLVFDIPLLARRLVSATRWLQTHPAAQGRKIALFGASTGAAAALVAAADLGREVAGVVSRGGRPDLAGPRLDEVTAPTLLIVGGEDHEVLELNRQAAAAMRAAAHRIEIVPGAGHLFEEPGALERVAMLATAWCRAAFDAHVA